MKSLISVVCGVLITFSVSAADVSMAVPGAKDATGRSVLTFIAKDPPGQRCNGNLQVAAEVANTYRVPIQLLPSSCCHPAWHQDYPHLPCSTARN